MARKYGILRADLSDLPSRIKLRTLSLLLFGNFVQGFLKRFQ